MNRFAFVFFATQWRRDLIWPFECCLHSLDSRGGRAADYPRYLIYPEEITPEIRRFCEEHRVILQPERRFTYRLAWPNKALMCRVPAHEVVCLLDLDLIFLDDPTPMFEQTAETGHAHSRLDLLVPLRPWTNLPEKQAEWARMELGGKIWRGQYARFGSADFMEVARTGGGTMPPYFNNGVNFIPGKHLPQLGKAWEHVARVLLRDIALHRPYTYFFTHYFLDQISYALALHRERIPWSILPSNYNFIPSEQLPEEEKRMVRAAEVVMAHMVSPVRHWLTPAAAAEAIPEVFRPLYSQIQQLVREIEAGQIHNSPVAVCGTLA